MEHIKNCGRRVACLELGCEWVRKEVSFCLFLVCPQSIVENCLEVGGRGICRASLGHECKSGDWCAMRCLRGRVVSWTNWTIGQRGIVQRAQGDRYSQEGVGPSTSGVDRRPGIATSQVVLIKTELKQVSKSMTWQKHISKCCNVSVDAPRAFGRGRDHHTYYNNSI